METVATYPDLISAQLAQSLLQAEGIDTSIPDENIAGIDWQWSTALHGIRLQVAPNDIESAMALLNTASSGLLSDETISPPQPTDLEQVERCPFCGSDLMGPGRWRRRGKALTMLVPILLLLWPLILAFGPTYECLECGRLWKRASDNE